MAHRFIHIAVLYLVVGAGLGLYMGIAGQFMLSPVHAHLGVLGWLTLAMAGVIYRLYPRAATSRLATLHFWLHNLGLPVFMVALALVVRGQPALVPVAAGAAIVVLVALVLFAVNVLRHVDSGGH